MKKLYSLSFKENRLVWLSPGPGEKPRPREAAEDAEKLQQKEYRELVKDVLKNTHEKGNMLKAEKRGEEGLKTFFKEYMLKYDKCKKILRTKKSNNPLADFQNENRMEEVYLKDGKEIDINNYTTGIINYLRSLGKAGRVQLANEAKTESAVAEKQRLTAKPNEFEEKNEWPSQEAANIANKFYSGVLQTVCNKAQKTTADVSQNKGITPDKLKTSLNQVLTPGVFIAKIRENYGIDSEDIKMNGPKAWPTINTPAKRAALQKKILKVIS